jgi:hypothetical protein
MSYREKNGLLWPIPMDKAQWHMAFNNHGLIVVAMRYWICSANCSRSTRTPAESAARAASWPS